MGRGCRDNVPWMSYRGWRGCRDVGVVDAVIIYRGGRTWRGGRDVDVVDAVIMYLEVWRDKVSVECVMYMWMADDDGCRRCVRG